MNKGCDTWVNLTVFNKQQKQAELHSAVGNACQYRKFESHLGHITYVEIYHEFIRFKNTPIQIYRKFHLQKKKKKKKKKKKTENFHIKTSDSFHISAQNIDCGCLLEPLRRGGSNDYSQSIFEQK